MKSSFLGGPAWNWGLKFDSCHFRRQNLREPLIQSINGPIKLPGFWGWYSFLGRGTLLKEMSSPRTGGQPSKTSDPSTGRVTDSKAMHMCPCVLVVTQEGRWFVFLYVFSSLNEHLFMTPFIFSVFWWVFKLKWPCTQRLATLHGQALKPKKKKKPKTGPLDLCHENLLTSTPKSHFPPWS